MVWFVLAFFVLTFGTIGLIALLSAVAASFGMLTAALLVPVGMFVLVVLGMTAMLPTL